MPEFIGANLKGTWVYATGTVGLDADFHVFSYSPSQDKYEATAGADANKTYITGAKDFTCSYTGVAQSAGTLYVQLGIGQVGTLTIYPEGTAVGKQKWTFPCFCTTDPITSIPYAGIVETNISWQGNGAYTLATN